MSKIRRNQVLRLNSSVEVCGHKVRSVRRMHNGALKVEIRRKSNRGGGEYARRWCEIGSLGIKEFVLKQAITASSKAQALSPEFAGIF